MDATELLEKYSDAVDALSAIDAAYEGKKQTILAPVQGELDALDAEFQPVRERASKIVLELKAQAADAVKRAGVTMVGTRHKAIFVRGSVHWNDSALLGYAIDHKDILDFRATDAPSVRLQAL